MLPTVIVLRVAEFLLVPDVLKLPRALLDDGGELEVRDYKWFPRSAIVDKVLKSFKCVYEAYGMPCPPLPPQVPRDLVKKCNRRPYYLGFPICASCQAQIIWHGNLPRCPIPFEFVQYPRYVQGPHDKRLAAIDPNVFTSRIGRYIVRRELETFCETKRRELLPEIDAHVKILLDRGYAGDPNWRKPLTREQILAGEEGEKWSNERGVTYALEYVRGWTNIKFLQ